MKIVLIDTSIPINTRNMKIIESLQKHYSNSEITVITWNRDNYSEDIPSYYRVYNQEAEYGNPAQKLLKLLGFKKFLRKELIHIQPDVIVVSHWDSLLLTPSDLKSKPMLIYENLDLPTGNAIIRKPIQWLETLKLKKAHLIVHASRFFKELYPIDIPQIILENKSTFAFDKVEPEQRERLSLAYIGTVRYRDILENFLNAATLFSSIDVKVFGDGQDLKYLKGKFENKNVSFHGSYKFAEIPFIYAKSDVVWAAYPNKDFNVIYAISNKLHESLACGVPCIFANNTKLGDFVQDNKIGFTVDPYSVDSIKELISSIIANKEKLPEYRKSITAFGNKELTWDEDFKELVSQINTFINKR